MKKIKILTYSIGFALSNKFLQSLEFMIFNEKIEVLFYKIKLSNLNETFSMSILGSRYGIMIFKYLFDQTRPIL